MPAAEVGPLRELLLLNRSQSKGKVKTAKARLRLQTQGLIIGTSLRPYTPYTHTHTRTHTPNRCTHTHITDTHHTHRESDTPHLILGCKWVQDAHHWVGTEQFVVVLLTIYKLHLVDTLVSLHNTPTKQHTSDLQYLPVASKP